MIKKVVLVSNGDFRDSANRETWAMQQETLNQVAAAFKQLGVKSEIAGSYDKKRGHGFISTQAEGCKVFAGIDPEAAVVIVLSCWCYAHHVAGPLQTHKGPILLLGNFDGTFPGLVALLNHSGTLARMNTPHSRIWSTDFTQDAVFMKNLKAWVQTGKIAYPAKHLADAAKLKVSKAAQVFAQPIAKDILQNKRILGQFDPGCMGMLNAVMSPDKLAGIGMPVELLSQSDLVAEMNEVKDSEAKAAYQFLKDRKATFHFGKNIKKDLTEAQVIEQMKMYIAAVRFKERFGLSALGIPYQIGLIRMAPASDLVEGILNNADRPPVRSPQTGKVIEANKVIPHFNEGDLGSGVPQVLMRDILWKKKMPAETTLHDVRWGDDYEGRFIWVLLISGGAPPAHFGGWKNTHIYRQAPMYFPKGGGTCSGVSKPGIITWARFYESFGKIGMDCGTGEVVKLPQAEVNRRLKLTNPEWPIANAYLPGYGRDELMATHQSNHITICYGDILQELVALCMALGIPTRVAGDARKAFQ